MLGCPVKSFAHRNPAVLKKLLEGAGRKCRPVVFTDGMFSADGAVAPVREYLQFLPRSGRIFVDDAHGVGLLGAHGRGTLELADVDYERVVQCGTLSKAFGAFGGIILATETVRRQIIARSRSYAGATPLPPPLAGAALASLKILQMARARRQRLAANVTWFRSAVAAAGWEIPATPGPIVRLPVLPAAEEVQLKRRLFAAGILPPYLKYGSAIHGTFRFVISSEHTRAQLERAATVLTRFKTR